MIYVRHGQVMASQMPMRLQPGHPSLSMNCSPLPPYTHGAICLASLVLALEDIPLDTD